MRVHLAADDPWIMTGTRQSELYDFHVAGELSEGIIAAFGNLKATRLSGETILTGTMPDQSALFGVLDLIESLGIHLIEVRRVQLESGI